MRRNMSQDVTQSMIRRIRQSILSSSDPESTRELGKFFSAPYEMRKLTASPSNFEETAEFPCTSLEVLSPRSGME
jgi:hypothetical protein